MESPLKFGKQDLSYNFRAVREEPLTLQEVNIHSTNIYLLPVYLGTVRVLELQRGPEINVLPKRRLLSSDRWVLR